MSDEDVRLSAAAEAAQNPPGPGPSARAYEDRQQRLAHDEAQMAAGAAPGHDQQTMHFGGQPSPAVQMKTHVPAPSTPYEGGGDSASDRIG